MATMSEAEDWTDNVLLEWSAALELHSRGVTKAVLPIIVGEEDFFLEAAAAFGGIAGLPTHVSTATCAALTTHLESITGDGSVDSAIQLVRSASGQVDDSEPHLSIQGVVSSLLKFQGIKLNRNDAAAGHAHGHTCMGATLDDLTVSVNRIRDTVSASFKQGVARAPQASSALPDGDLGRQSLASRFSTRMRGSGAAEADPEAHRL